MPYLDAALAFALTMLAVATLVTQFVRLLHIVAGTRVTIMREMLEEYFKKELKPVVDRELSRLKKQISEEVAKEVGESADKLGVTLPFTTEELATLVDVPNEELTERLKRSEMGKKLLEELGDKAQDVFDELQKHYEMVGNKFTQSFRTNARTWATIFALILAFILNIDSLFIANTYITNQGMREAVIAQRDSLEEGYTTLAEQFDKDKDKTEFTREEFEAAFGNTQEQLDVFTSVGFPLGWSYYPYAAINGEPSKDYASRDSTPGFIMWIIGCILTGLLAGLGGPFWYDMVAGISHAVESVRGQKK